MNPAADGARCPGCGGVFAEATGPTHPYMECSPGCWAAYGELLAREYQEPARMALHRLTVDAFAVQHPGRPEARSIQSVAVHLVSLHLVLERGWLPPEATRALARLADQGKFHWLTPPENRGALTHAGVLAAGTAEQHLALVSAWSETAWTAWAAHHAQVRAWAGAAAGSGGP